MSTQTKLDIVACGKIAERLLCQLSVLRRAAADVGIFPVLRIDGVDYFAAGDVDSLEGRVRELQAFQRRDFLTNDRRHRLM